MVKNGYLCNAYNLKYLSQLKKSNIRLICNMQSRNENDEVHLDDSLSSEPNRGPLNNVGSLQDRAGIHQPHFDPRPPKVVVPLQDAPNTTDEGASDEHHIVERQNNYRPNGLNNSIGEQSDSDMLDTAGALRPSVGRHGAPGCVRGVDRGAPRVQVERRPRRPPAVG